MANFTDSIPQFNDYVQQLPIDAMVQVGTQKQQAYNQGIQKIQSDIETIAGMDVSRDVDKAYLQSKVNQLGNNLRPFMASDFSEYQLVNSVSGMTSAIADDPNVQTAVASTAFYRKQREEMEKAISEGKSSIQNQWDFGNNVNNWINNPELGVGFNSRYTQYIDVEKKFLEVYKNLHPDLTEQDIPYVRNPDGSLNYNKTAAAMQRVSKETVSAAKIENALRASLSPDELNQLSIDGRYQFRGYDSPEKLAMYSQARYEGTFNLIDSQIEKLEGLLTLSSSNPKEHDETKNSIRELQEGRQKIKEQMDEEIAMIQANPDQAKATIYKNGAITQFANAHSWETNKINLLENPILKAEQWERTHQFDREKHNWTKFKDQHSMKMDESNYSLKYQEMMYKYHGVQGEFEVYGGTSTKVKSPTIALIDAIDEKDAQAGSILNELVKSDKKTTKEMWVKRMEEYKNDRSKIPAEWEDKINTYLDLVKSANNLKSGVEKARQEVLGSDAYKATQNQIIKDLESVPVNGITITREGSKTSFSKKELYDFYQKQRKSIFAEEVWIGGVGITEESREKLTNKEKLLADHVYSQTMTREERQKIHGVFRKFRPVVDKYKDNAKETQQKIEDLLLERTFQFVPVVRSITVSEKEGDLSRAKYEGLAQNLLMSYSSENLAKMEGGTAELTPSEINTYRDWFLKPESRKSIQYKEMVQGDKRYLVLVKGNEEAMIPLPDNVRLPTSPNSPSNSYKNLLTAMQLGDGNTNPTGKIENSYFAPHDFPLVKDLRVTADLKQVKGNDNKVLINLNLKLDSGWKNIQLNRHRFTVEDAEKFVQGLTDEYIKDIYLSTEGVPDSWKKEIQSKKTN